MKDHVNEVRSVHLDWTIPSGHYPVRDELISLSELICYSMSHLLPAAYRVDLHTLIPLAYIFADAAESLRTLVNVELALRKRVLTASD